MARVIARLDIKGPNLVKGIHMEGLRVLGKPEEFAQYYYETGADELMYIDVVASLYGRNSLLDIVTRTAREVFIPLCVGGGLRSVADIRAVLRAGADKVSMNTAAIRRPALIKEAAETFGSSTIVVSVEAIGRSDGTYEAYTDHGRERTGVDALTWAQEAAEQGAGELVITSINREGTGEGFDIGLIRSVTDAVSIPVIAHGGAGRTTDVRTAITDGGANAVALASLLHYYYIAQGRSRNDFKNEGNTEFLKRGSGFSKIEPASIGDIKRSLRQAGIDCRPPEYTLT